MFDIIASIVLYKNKPDEIKRVIDNFLNTNLNIKLYVVDNSSTDNLRKLCTDDRIGYIFNNDNIGFGAAHNVAIEKAIGNSKYYLILNPDVYFKKGTLEKIHNFMEENYDIGLAMPKVLYPNDEMQYLCKLSPTPFDLILRRFLPFKKYLERRNQKYELRFADYNEVMDVPYLSGCFMFIRTEVFKEVGIFDERYFMYLEDTDLSRRIHERYRTVYYPEATVYPYMLG
jgi:GT2 family glycosyltransferase